MQINLGDVAHGAEKIWQQYKIIRQVQDSLEYLSAFFDPSQDYYAEVRKKLQENLGEMEEQGRILSQMSDTLRRTEYCIRQAERQVCGEYSDGGICFVKPAIGRIRLDLLSPCPWMINLSE